MIRAHWALPSPVAAALAAVAGFAGWAAFSLGGTVGEAWDSSTWWMVALPLLAVAVALLGYLAPERAWRWAIAAVCGQLLAMMLLRPPATDLGLLPLAVVLVLVPEGLTFGVLAIIGGAIGQHWRNRRNPA